MKKSHLPTTQEHKTFPLSENEWRKTALEAAKITEEEIGGSVRNAFDENNRLLQAVRTEVKVIDGQPVTTEYPDNGARQRAIESIYDLSGVRAPSNSRGGGSGPTLVLNLPNYYDPEFIKRDRPKVNVVDAEEE